MMHRYRYVAKKGSGAFSDVHRAEHKMTKRPVAIKCIRKTIENMRDTNRMMEIRVLKALMPHENIIDLLDVVYEEHTGHLALIFELMDNNLYEATVAKKEKREKFSEEATKNVIWQLLKAIDHMHSKNIFHRDIKPENVLLRQRRENSNDSCHSNDVDRSMVVKLADFGSCCLSNSSGPHTEYISTRWYRPPECLLTDGWYTNKMDIWGLGCVFYEILTLEPLFPGENEIDQIHKIHKVLGVPNNNLIRKFRRNNRRGICTDLVHREGSGVSALVPYVSPGCVDLLCKLLAYDPDERCCARTALQHPYFNQCRMLETPRSVPHSIAARNRRVDGGRMAGSTHPTVIDKETSQPPSSISGTPTHLKATPEGPRLMDLSLGSSGTIQKKTVTCTAVPAAAAPNPVYKPKVTVDQPYHCVQTHPADTAGVADEMSRRSTTPQTLHHQSDNMISDKECSLDRQISSRTPNGGNESGVIITNDLAPSRLPRQSQDQLLPTFPAFPAFPAMQFCHRHANHAITEQMIGNFHGPAADGIGPAAVLIGKMSNGNDTFNANDIRPRPLGIVTLLSKTEQRSSQLYHLLSDALRFSKTKKSQSRRYHRSQSSTVLLPDTFDYTINSPNAVHNEPGQDHHEQLV